MIATAKQSDLANGPSGTLGRVSLRCSTLQRGQRHRRIDDPDLIIRRVGIRGARPVPKRPVGKSSTTGRQALGKVPPEITIKFFR